MSTEHHRRAFGYDFTLTNELGDDLDGCFATFEHAVAGGGTQPHGLHLRPSDDDFVELSIDGVVAFRTLDVGVLVHQTVWEITRRAVETVADALVLHAGVVVLDGLAVVVSGPSGAGKSTLTTALVTRGAHYLTDEAVVLDGDGRLGGAIRRPVELSARSLAMLDLADKVTVRLPDGSGYLPMPHAAAGRSGASARIERVAVVLLGEQPGPLEVRRPARSEVAATLLRESFDGQALTQRGLGSVKNLSIWGPSVAMSGGSVTERANALEILAQTT